MKRITKYMGIALLALAVVQCKTKPSDSGSGAAASAPKTTADGPAAPGTMTAPEAADAMQKAADTYANSPTCQTNPSLPSCQNATVISSQDPAATGNLTDGVAAMTGTTPPSTPTASNEPTATPSPSQEPPALPIAVEALQASNAGYSTQQYWGIGLMAVGAVATVAGAVGVFAYRDQVLVLKNEAVAAAQRYKDTLSRMVVDPLSDQARSVYEKIQGSRAGEWFTDQAGGYDMIGDDDKVAVLETFEADNEARLATGEIDEVTWKQRVKAVGDAFKAIKIEALNAPALERAQRMLERMGSSLNAVREAAAKVTGPVQENLKARATAMQGFLGEQVNAVQEKIHDRAVALQANGVAVAEDIQGRATTFKNAYLNAESLNTFFETHTKLAPVRTACVAAYDATIAAQKKASEVSTGMVKTIKESAAYKAVGAKAGQVKDYLAVKNRGGKISIGSVVIGAVTMLGGGYLYSSGAPSGAMGLAEGTTDCNTGDDTANYVCAMGNIAMQLQGSN